MSATLFRLLDQAFKLCHLILLLLIPQQPQSLLFQLVLVLPESLAFFHFFPLSVLTFVPCLLILFRLLSKFFSTLMKELRLGEGLGSLLNQIGSLGGLLLAMDNAALGGLYSLSFALVVRGGSATRHGARLFFQEHCVIVSS